MSVLNIDRYAFPQIDMDGKSMCRYFSETNPWIDVVVIVNNADAVRTNEIILEAMEKYWNCVYECYGDSIEACIEDADIHHQSVYHDANDESGEYELAWERYIAYLYAEQKNKSAVFLKGESETL